MAKRLIRDEDLADGVHEAEPAAGERPRGVRLDDATGRVGALREGVNVPANVLASAILD